MNDGEKYNIGYYGGDSHTYDPAVEAGKKARYWHEQMIKDAGSPSTSTFSPPRASGSYGQNHSLSRSVKNAAIGFGLLALLAVFLIPNTLTLIQSSVAVVGASALGMTVVVVLYALYKLIAITLRVALALLAVGGVLHLLGYIDIFVVGRQLFSL